MLTVLLLLFSLMHRPADLRLNFLSKAVRNDQNYFTSYIYKKLSEFVCVGNLYSYVVCATVAAPSYTKKSQTD